jgi:hypothetical protein
MWSLYDLLSLYNVGEGEGRGEDDGLRRVVL